MEMMMHEQWKKWAPIDGLSPRYYIEAIHDIMDGFSIILVPDEDTTSKVIIAFENSVEAYRATDESFRQKTLLKLSREHGIGLLGQWALFKVHNSSYIHWVSEESFNITGSLQLQHFVFIGGNQIVDVLSTDEPKIELIE